MISAKQLAKKFGDRTVVDDLSFELEKGDVLGFLGPNGAGKTTTMRILTCYFPPSSGSATVAGFDIQSDSIQVRRNIGYLPEQVPLYPEMTAREYIDFAASAKGVPGRERKKAVDEAMSRCNLGQVENQLVGTLSRGFRQRVGLAQAIVNRPKVLILDEPTVGLDPAQIRDIRDLIKALAETSTVILSTHILPEVEAICNRVIILSNGRIRAIDTPSNLNASLQGTSTLQLQVRGASTDEVVQAFSQVPGVRKTEHPMPGVFRLEIDARQDPRAELGRLVIARNWDLLEMATQNLSLEDIFLTIVKDGGGTTAPDADESAETATMTSGGDA